MLGSGVKYLSLIHICIEEAIHIVEGLKEKYENYHGVTYEPDVIPYAVKVSARYITFAMNEIQRNAISERFFFNFLICTGIKL